MALIQLSFKSRALMLQTSVNVLLPVGMNAVDFTPTDDFSYGTDPFPVLYLLHGATDDYSAWLRLSSIERYAEEKKLAVVMPNADMSAYTDMVHGHRYWTYISKELPEFMKATFPISQHREDTFVAGLSMGGYGAFKLALRQPERFAAAVSLSGAVDMREASQPDSLFVNAFGEGTKIAGTDLDLFHLIKKLAVYEGAKPALFQACGTEDFLYEDNVRFRDYARQVNADLTYEEGPGGHEWAYWDRMIARALDWLPLKTTN
ncbi:esterase family protein [Salipaludibacillus agaradhaerens]|uniref:alpha/beta hydrolase n=1 Tax=Salipaludibacillus agaradhaerens TaxID=76935 RepID=UPI0021519F84|nr:alpha/beta hydrolase family protein [Salipaludibacillus agaradhaerens]MCR6105727.1 esterase family protein [Salipaludibacillus agaradhaerens]MCR6117763.1 esterase family protein [Salipaludibacillus agaradhaerens]UJW56932.1 esterase family protein [Bacillus sp. A116_S68]